MSDSSFTRFHAKVVVEGPYTSAAQVFTPGALLSWLCNMRCSACPQKRLRIWSATPLLVCCTRFPASAVRRVNWCVCKTKIQMVTTACIKSL